ncbi:MAG TPA: hypothetical protein VM694_34175, partial [Polyangium sp.]|nr:hypothetical protein [Polyangium sp.]
MQQEKRFVIKWRRLSFVSIVALLGAWAGGGCLTLAPGLAPGSGGAGGANGQGGMGGNGGSGGSGGSGATGGAMAGSGG